MPLKGTERITTKGQDVNPYKINEKELARLYTSLAKRLNQRMEQDSFLNPVVHTLITM